MNKYVSELSVELNRLSAGFTPNDALSEAWIQTLKQSVQEMNSMESNIDVLARNIEELGKSLQKTEDKTKSFVNNFKMDKVVDGAKAAATAITGVEDNTRAYRKIMANLKSAGTEAGYTAEETAASFELLYGVLGDNTSAANAVTGLQSLGLTQGDLNGVITASIGAWATYGNSIPIASLSEAIGETVKIGEATGAFSDLLKEAGVDAADFNFWLKSAASKQTKPILSRSFWQAKA